MADCMVLASEAASEPMEEDEAEEDKEVDMGKGSSAEDLGPKQVPGL